MAKEADLEKLAAGSTCSVYLARGAPSHKQWESLSDREKAGLQSRFTLISMRELLAKDKLRPIRGSDGILEIKRKKPPLRCLAFKNDGDWFITHIIIKPKKNRVLAEARKAEMARERHFALEKKKEQ